jgi:hypothetical protein
MIAIDVLTDRLRRHCRSTAKIGLQYIAPVSAGQQRVLLVTGQQRSGTNMLMEAFERNWCTDVYHETDPRAFESYQMRDLKTIQSIVASSKAKLVVIKALCEAQRIRDLLDSFPGALAIWAVRNYHDVSDSMARQFSSTADILNKMRDDPAIGGWRGERLSPSTQTLLDDCIDDKTTEISAAAFQWYMRNQLYFDQGFDRDRRVKLVFYENLVKQPMSTFNGIASFLGIDFDPSMVSDFHTDSIARGRRATIDSRIENLCQQLLGRLTICAQMQA